MGQDFSCGTTQICFWNSSKAHSKRLTRATSPLLFRNFGVRFALASPFENAYPLYSHHQQLSVRHRRKLLLLFTGFTDYTFVLYHDLINLSSTFQQQSQLNKTREKSRFCKSSGVIKKFATPISPQQTLSSQLSGLPPFSLSDWNKRTVCPASSGLVSRGSCCVKNGDPPIRVSPTLHLSKTAL